MYAIRSYYELQQLIENLLSFSAWQAKSEILTLSDFQLRALVISVAKEQRLALKSAGIQLRLEVEDIIVNADRDKIRTVLDNLLSNAVKFTPKGGMVRITSYNVCYTKLLRTIAFLVLAQSGFGFLALGDVTQADHEDAGTGGSDLMEEADFERDELVRSLALLLKSWAHRRTRRKLSRTAHRLYRA